MDVFFAEYVTPYEDIAQIWAVLDELWDWKERGLIRYVGVTTHNRAIALDLIKSDRIEVLMHRYNMAHRKAEEQVFPMAQQVGIPLDLRVDIVAAIFVLLCDRDQSENLGDANMSYSEFSLEQVVREFNLNYQEDERIFPEIELVEPSNWLRETLDFNLPLAIAIGSEKARSEMLIAPIIWEMKRRQGGAISIFSGREFNVDASRGLTGFVDFLIAKARQQAFIGLPVVVLVEAKKSDLTSGYGQCAAEMVAAQIKNSQPEASQVQDCLEKGILGIITNGTVWQFLHLKGQELVLDLAEYSIDELPLLLGVLEEFTRI